MIWTRAIQFTLYDVMSDNYILKVVLMNICADLYGLPSCYSINNFNENKTGGVVKLYIKEYLKYTARRTLESI